MMLSIVVPYSKLSLFLLTFLALPVHSVPKGNSAIVNKAANASRNGNSKVTTASDGSMILDKTVIINGLPIRYKVSAPPDQFTTTSGIPGASAQPKTTGANGLNVLLHGDGGQSFTDFPNQAVQNGLMGVVVLAPNNKRFWGGGSGLQRTDGEAHAAAVNSLIQDQLSQDVAFDPSKVFFTGVSGGSLLLSGFFVPAYGDDYKTGVLLNCGGLTPQVPVVNSSGMIANMKIHFQSTKKELTLLQPELPRAISAYEKMATDAGLSKNQISKLQTVDNTPNGGHCEFDGKDFVSGVQLMSSNYANIIGDNASGDIQGIGNVLTSVVGNEMLQFTGGK
ncbi:putative cyclin-like f-box protein [Erysiphe neolycopersici]|uniref:Putative cyclin-like f-box protein n=1 Tax=Erysiphe neolycopersici TaxID=212602 RepID=A0A420I0L1_9PEZI|nr:putative cyclin-like f-box protein [Erysiphe neolycopersici]